MSLGGGVGVNIGNVQGANNWLSSVNVGILIANVFEFESAEGGWFGGESNGTALGLNSVETSLTDWESSDGNVSCVLGLVVGACE